MKNRLLQYFSALTILGVTHGQSDYVKKLPLVNFELECLSENDLAIEGVDASAHDDAIGNKEQFREGESRSNKDGKSFFSFHAIAGVSVYAQKNGYYPSIAPARHENPIDERFRFDPFIRDDVDPRRDREVPLPMKKEVKLEASITLREIKNPISLYVKAIQMDIPARDVWLGYDFEVGDWVKPYGNGIKSDMRIRSAPKRLDPEVTDGGVLLPGVATLEIDFGQDGGLVRVTKDNGWLSVSEMKMPHLAPEAGYEQLPTLKIEQTTFEDSSEMGKANGYFFRTRVKREGDKVISANYGKLLGRINYRPVQLDKAWWGDEKKNAPAFGSIEFTYYFNPTVNERNLEFDVKQNLFKRSDQWLRQP
jgi:hypothetical protein